MNTCYGPSRLGELKAEPNNWNSKDPSTDLTDFNCNYLNKLLENISKEQKSIFLLGDFNVNLLNYHF